jgi:glycosyltransferase involved in cell wall biosynthesis
MKFSIITVCYNAQSTIAQTLESVVQQDWPDFEHIIIDGKSTDGTLDVVTSHRHARLSVFSEPDLGIYDAMNKGLAHAKGEYVAFLNADDRYCRNDAISLAASAAISSNADCILADTLFENQKGRNLFRRYYSARYFRRWWLKCGVMPPHPSCFVRRATLQKAGGFDTGFEIAADFDLMARVILRDNASWFSVGETTTLFRIGGLSTRGNEVRRKLTAEFTQSLESLGVKNAWISVRLRYPFKLLQYVSGFWLYGDHEKTNDLSFPPKVGR